MIVLSHRGRHAGNVHADNTLDAFSGAMGTGVDGVEVDVRVTRDGEAVLFHDPRTRGRRAVATLTRDRLATFARHDVPTLGEALARFPHAIFDVELKTGSALDAVAPAIKAVDPARILVTSFHRAFVAAAARRLRVPCGLILARRPRSLVKPPWKLFAANRYVRTVVLPLGAIDEHLVEAAHADGMSVFAWRLSKPAHRRRAAALGLDGIIVDA